jgi:hypothetical protein
MSTVRHRTRCAAHHHIVLATTFDDADRIRHSAAARTAHERSGRRLERMRAGSDLATSRNQNVLAADMSSPVAIGYGIGGNERCSSRGAIWVCRIRWQRSAPRDFEWRRLTIARAQNKKSRASSKLQIEALDSIKARKVQSLPRRRQSCRLSAKRATAAIHLVPMQSGGAPIAEASNLSTIRRVRHSTELFRATLSS